MEEDEFMQDKYTPEEIQSLKKDHKKAVEKRAKFIDKYPMLNPKPITEEEKIEKLKNSMGFLRKEKVEYPHDFNWLLSKKSKKK